MSKFHDEFFRKKTSDHDKLTAHYIKNIRKMTEIVLKRANVEYGDMQIGRPELERICYPPSTDDESYRSKFIIGYIDISYKVGFHSVVVEIKPRMDSWGGPLRQIKTYMKSERADVGVLVSYDDISLEELELLEAEKVYFIHVEREEEAMKEVV